MFLWSCRAGDDNTSPFGASEEIIRHVAHGDDHAAVVARGVEQSGRSIRPVNEAGVMDEKAGALAHERDEVAVKKLVQNQRSAFPR